MTLGIDPERWREIERLYQLAQERAPGEREAFLSNACAGDEDLRKEVAALLADQSRIDRFIETPALNVAAQALAQDQAQATLKPGQTVARYTIVEETGRGGMGVVYKAKDTSLGRFVALKFLPEAVSRDRQAIERFQREAKAASALNHPNICTIYEISQHEGQHFIAMEFLEGKTLKERIVGKPLGTDEILDLGIQIADGSGCRSRAGDHSPRHQARQHLRDQARPRQDPRLRPGEACAGPGAGRQGRQRRRLPPSQPKTSLTSPGTAIGTMAYMSPEQALGQDLDARTDLFSLGVVLYEMATGMLPFRGSTSAATFDAILNKAPTAPIRINPDLPEDLERIINKALEKDRKLRYQHASDMIADLQRLKRDSDSGRSAAAAGKDADRGEAAARRRKWVVPAIAAAVILAIAGFWYFTPRAPALTSSDTILLADFVNTTGDPVFDGTLKEALTAKLLESPFLNIFPDERVQESLKLMERSAGDKVTSDIGREICLRQGLKAMIVGSISAMGSSYTIQLKAVEAQTGTALVIEQIEATRKEEIVRQLGIAAANLRGKLGERLSMVEKFNAPLDQATTSSLDALKSYSSGREKTIKGEYLDAIAFYKHALELDPNFAVAYSGLAAMYFNTGKAALAREAAQKAYDLRDRVSEREKFRLECDFQQRVTLDMEQALEVGKVWAKTYPNDPIAHNSLGNAYFSLGQLEKAAQEYIEHHRLLPQAAPSNVNLAGIFIKLNKFQEAEELCDQALSRGMETLSLHYLKYELAAVRSDTAAMEKQIEWLAGGNSYYGYWQQSTVNAFYGQLKKAQHLGNQASKSAEANGNVDAAASYLTNIALLEASFGFCESVPGDTAKALALSRTGAREYSLWALSICGKIDQADSLAEEWKKVIRPLATVDNKIYFPITQALIHLQRKQFDKAIQILQPVLPYERAAGFNAMFFRGQAYLALGDGKAASAEFQKIVDHRGLAPLDYYYPMAYLYLGRSARLEGDLAKSRKAYQDFLALWKDADPDIPILIAARAEYEKLK